MLNDIKSGQKLTDEFVTISLIATLIGSIGLMHSIHIAVNRFPIAHVLFTMQESQNEIPSGECNRNATEEISKLLNSNVNASGIRW